MNAAGAPAQSGRRWATSVVRWARAVGILALALSVFVAAAFVLFLCVWFLPGACVPAYRPGSVPHLFTYSRAQIHAYLRHATELEEVRWSGEPSDAVGARRNPSGDQLYLYRSGQTAIVSADGSVRIVSVPEWPECGDEARPPAAPSTFSLELGLPAGFWPGTGRILRSVERVDAEGSVSEIRSTVSGATLVTSRLHVTYVFEQRGQLYLVGSQARGPLQCEVYRARGAHLVLEKRVRLPSGSFGRVFVEDLDPWSDNLLLRDHRDDVPGEWLLFDLATERTRWIGAPDDHESKALFLVRDLLAR